MMASSAETPRTYHVFMSFRGPDVRKNFASLLYRALDQSGIYTYIDNEELRKGESISPALLKAINESRIAVVIFSENYAESRWCLEELGEIMECNKRNDLIVLPVFYKVEPREVRGRRQSYGRAMAKHERKFKKDSEKLKQWKEALDNAGSLSGWDLNSYGNEADLIEDIVKQISIRLNQTPLHVTEYPVGLDSRVEVLKSMLSLKSKDDVRMVGLWGPGGIGKTTLAKATYNAIFRKFVGSSFIAHIREKADDLVSLQRQLLSEILPNKTLTISSVDRGIALIKDRLCSKKVLLVLDDVDDLKQLKIFAGACDWFGQGSRIIITTRDKHLLTSHGVDHILEVKPLNDREVRELFCLHCFRKGQSIEISEDIIQSALRYANGFPLVLEVLGSHLRGRSEIEWKSTLTKFESSPEQTINRVLKVSFDALDCNEKEIFLDIACFFKGCEIEYVKKVLDSCGFCSTIGVKILIEKALISEEHGTLQMHDLVQLIGRDIVKQECPKDPSKRSRLWLYDDALDVLTKDMGTDSTKAIGLKLSLPGEITIHLDALTNMKKLRLLILLIVCVSFEAPIYLPSELRWLEWPKYSAPTLKFNLGQCKLVGLDISNSHLREVGVLTKQLKNLKFLNCAGCKLLVNIPDLSGIPNLETLNLFGCENLVGIDQSVGFLKKLKFLSLDRTAIEEVPSSLGMAISLEMINLSSCRNLTSLPSSLYNLNRLRHLILRGCSRLIQFPEKMDDSVDPHGSLGFGALRSLNLSSCNLLEVGFLDNLSCFPALRSLHLSGNNISSLPSSINKRDRLEILHVDKCDRIREIPELPPTIRQLGATNCNSLCSVPNLSKQPRGFITADFSSCPQSLDVSNIFPLEGISDQTVELELRLTGDEMPSWMFPVDVDGGCVRLYDSRLSPSECVGLALCAVFGPDDGDVEFTPIVFNTRRKDIQWNSPSSRWAESDTVWFRFISSSEVFPEGVDEADREYCVGIGSETGINLKKWGWRIIWKDGGDDDSDAVVQPQRLIESDDCSEDSDSAGDEETESGGDNLVSKEDNGGDDREFKWAQPLWKGCLALVIGGLAAASLRKR